MIIFSFNDSDTMSRSVFSGFSLRWYARLFQDRMILEALKNTLIIAVVAAVGCDRARHGCGHRLNGIRNKWVRRMMMNVTNLPMVNPEIVTGVSLMLLFVFVAQSWEGFLSGCCP